MAELSARIIAKASSTPGEAPDPTDLEVAEIAVNTADGTFFTKHTDGTIKTISGSGGGGGGGGAVDSVNGETGVVELGAFDLTDVNYNYSSSGWAWIGTTVDLANDGLEDGDALGDHGGHTSVHPISSDGSDVEEALRAWANANPAPYNMGVSVDGVVTNVTVTEWRDEMNDGGAYEPRLRIGTGGESPLIALGARVTLPDFDAWAVANGFERTDEVALPIADGEVLVYNGAYQEWRPQQSSEVIDKATLKAAVAASTDFADFQSRIASL